MIRWLWSKTPWEKRRINRLRDQHEAAMLRLQRELDLEDERRLEKAKWLRVIRPSPVSNKSPVARSDAPQVRFESNPSTQNPMQDAYWMNSINESAPITGHQWDSTDTSNSCSSSSSSSDSSSSSSDSSSSSCDSGSSSSNSD